MYMKLKKINCKRKGKPWKNLLGLAIFHMSASPCIIVSGSPEVVFLLLRKQEIPTANINAPIPKF